MIHVWQDVAASVETLIAYSNSKAEMLALLIKELKQIVVIIYRPPDTSENESQAVIDKLENILKNTSNPATEILILGDFNMPPITWPYMHIKGGTVAEKHQAEKLITLTEGNFLHQLVLEPTRGQNTLDLIITNNREGNHTFLVFSAKNHTIRPQPHTGKNSHQPPCSKSHCRPTIKH